MRVTLNLASRPYVELRPLYQRLRVLALLLVLAAASFWWVLRTQKEKAAEAHTRATKIESAIHRTEAERISAEASMRQPQNAAVLAQAQFLNNLFLHKAFSWTAVMMDLEQVLPSGVQVMNIDPQVAKDGNVTIRMRVAGTRDRAVTLVRNLEHSRRFVSPRIVGETAQGTSPNGQPNPAFQPVSQSNGVNFDLLAEYRPLEVKDERQPDAAARKEHVAAPSTHRQGRARKTTPDRSTP